MNPRGLEQDCVYLILNFKALLPQISKSRYIAIWLRYKRKFNLNLNISSLSNGLFLCKGFLKKKKSSHSHIYKEF